MMEVLRNGERVGSYARLEEGLEALARLPEGEFQLLESGPAAVALYYYEGGRGPGGDGSRQAPWWGLQEAARALQSRGLGGGLRLVPCPIFSASPLELAKRKRERWLQWLLGVCTMLLVLPILGILGYLIVKAWPALSFSFLWENPRDRLTAGGLWAPLVGTFCLVFLSLAVSAPIGILAGVYLNEYARDNWATRVINLAVVNLAGVPSIVHGLFGVGAFVLFARLDRSLLAASCTLAVMTLPVIVTSTRAALASVPMAFREACWNLGATRWQTVRTMVLPNAISGILTGVILQVSRAAGETAPILFTGAVLSVPVADHGWAAFFPYGLDDRVMALSMHLYTLLTQVTGVPTAYEYGTAVVLIGLVLTANSLSIWLRSRLRSQKKW